MNILETERLIIREYSEADFELLEAANACTNYAFDHLKLNRLCANMAIDHVRSQNVAH